MKQRDNFYFFVVLGINEKQGKSSHNAFPATGLSIASASARKQFNAGDRRGCGRGNRCCPGRAALGDIFQHIISIVRGV